MITTMLKGGLGNQIFQYAIGRAIAEFSNDDLSLDVIWYKQSRQWPYPFHLDKFNICDKKDSQPGTRIKEEGYKYNLFVSGIHNENIVLDGYWQDERYFYDIQELICNDLQLKPEHMSDEYHLVEGLISQIDEPVFVHIRRAERVTDKQPRSVHGLIHVEFYNDAINYMRHLYPLSTMLFFTDDVEYTKSKFADEGPVIYPISDYEHLSLMSKCKHAIIANSSFSWWAAWLMQNPDKIIIAPSKWTVDPKNSNPDIVPKSWIKMDPKF